MRAVTSATPPAPKGSTRRTGFSGHFACASLSGASAKIRAAGSASIVFAKTPLAIVFILRVFLVSFLLLFETIKLCGIVHQQAALRQRFGRELRHQIDQIGLIGLVGGIRVWKVGAP